MAGKDDGALACGRQEAMRLGLRQYTTNIPCPAGHIGPRYVTSMGCVRCTIESTRRRRKTKAAGAPPTPKAIAKKARGEALREGRTRYFTGIPCQRGHLAERFTDSKTCVQCDLDRKVGDEATRLRLRAYYRLNRNAILAQGEEYRIANAARISARRKTFREANKERLAAEQAAFWKANPDKRRAKERAREGRERGAEGTHTAADIESIRRQQRDRCANPACRKRLHGVFHVDHVQPIALGGTNWPRNLQLLCAPCNQAKHARDPIAWAQSNGLLL